MELAKRMKEYEDTSENTLPARLPIIMRLDGNSFSKLNYDKPFDERFEVRMRAAAAAVYKYCSGAEFCYTQSDEISILLRNDQTYGTQPFLANRTQKLASLCASKASIEFGEAFDCRVFVLPPDEVVNYFLWRQRDCFKNCISSFAYWGLVNKHGRKTAQKMLHGKTTNDRQEIIYHELGINPGVDIPMHRRRGSCLQRRTVTREDGAVRTEYQWDLEIPLFSQDRNYVGMQRV